MPSLEAVPPALAHASHIPPSRPAHPSAWQGETPAPADVPPPFAWKLYFLALAGCNAHPYRLNSRLHLMHRLGVPPQVGAEHQQLLNQQLPRCGATVEIVSPLLCCEPGCCRCCRFPSWRASAAGHLCSGTMPHPAVPAHPPRRRLPALWPPSSAWPSKGWALLRTPRCMR